VLNVVGSWMCAQRPIGVTLPEDMVRQEANHAKNERQHTQK
jgi:hypothetical protein